MQNIRVINSLLPLDIGGAIYITDQFRDVERIARMNVTNKEVAIRIFIKNGTVIFWNADILMHQDVINRTKDFAENALKKFSLSQVDLNTWHRGIIFFKEDEQGLRIEAIDPRTKAGEEELLSFLNNKTGQNQ